MNAGQREHLLELHRMAVQLWGLASTKPGHWEAAFKADQAFTDYLNMLDIDPHFTGNTEQP
jgi:hypothetical protein